MIKIIKQGTRKKMSCEDCGCLFSYEGEDIQTEANKYENRCYKKIIICPQCCKKIRIEGSK